MRAIYYEAGLRLGLTAGGDAALSGEGSLSASGSAEAFGAASLSGSSSLSAAGAIPGGEDDDDSTGPLIGPPLLAGAPLGSLPVAAMGPILASADALTTFEQMADLAEVNVIHLVKLSPLTTVS
jgi:hypothetical protein